MTVLGVTWSQKERPKDTKKIKILLCIGCRNLFASTNKEQDLTAGKLAHKSQIQINVNGHSSVLEHGYTLTKSRASFMFEATAIK